MDRPVGEPQAKRRKTEGEATSSLRSTAIEAFPDFVTPAKDAVRVAVKCSKCSRTDGAGYVCEPFVPLFVHQQFEGEKIFGFKEPKLTITYHDASLAMEVEVSAKETIGPEAGAVPDDFLSALRNSLSDTLLEIFRGAAGSKDKERSIHCKEEDAVTFSLPGQRLARYVVNGRVFVVHRWSPSDPLSAAASYHDRMSTLAMWLIETASPIDVKDWRWRVYGLFEEKTDNNDGEGEKGGEGEGKGAAAAPVHYHFCGYATTYQFVNPFAGLAGTLSKKKTGSGSKAAGGSGVGDGDGDAAAAPVPVPARDTTIRLAQLLLLPSYQRQNHGFRLLAAIHADAEDKGRFTAADEYEGLISPSTSLLGLNAAEISVESPCEGMRALRDVYDACNAACSGVFNEVLKVSSSSSMAAAITLPAPLWTGLESSTQGSSSSASSTLPPPLEPSSITHVHSLPSPFPLVSRARDVLRTTVGQVNRAFEALLLARINRADEEGAFKKYRLAVKRRLLETDEDVAAIVDADKRKKSLEMLFQRCLADYCAVLIKLGLMDKDKEGKEMREKALAAAKKAQQELEEGEDGGD